jgi:hypothetical protein
MPSSTHAYAPHAPYVVTKIVTEKQRTFGPMASATSTFAAVTTIFCTDVVSGLFLSPPNYEGVSAKVEWAQKRPS